MLPSISPRFWYLSKVLLLLISLTLLTTYLYLQTSTTSPSLYHLTTSSSKKTQFIDSFLSKSNGQFNNQSLIKLCKETKWQPGLIFQCEVPPGGVVNSRNVILSCARYTILAGATSLILPHLSLPVPEESDSPPETLPMDHLFDTSHFTSLLSSTCPQISLIGTKDDLWSFPTTAKPVLIRPASISSSPLILNAMLSHPETWRDDLMTKLNRTFTPERPVLVNLQGPSLEFPLSYDSPEFVSSFSHILRPNPTIRRLAATILFALSEKHSLPLSLSNTIPFLGIHLRSGPDAENANWTSLSTQITNSLSLASNTSLSLLYISSLETSALSQFSGKAASYGISPLNSTVDQQIHVEVETAASLLAGEEVLGTSMRDGAKGFEEEWGVMRGLEWDQKLLVDFEVLMWGRAFVGIWESSFSWGVGLRRSLMKDEKSEEAGLLGGKDGKLGDGKIGEGKEEGGRNRTRGYWQDLDLKSKDPSKIGEGKKKQVKVGDVTWRDGNVDERGGLSVIYGPEGEDEGRRVRWGLWA